MINKKILLYFFLASIALSSGYFFNKTSHNSPILQHNLFTTQLTNLKKETLTLKQYKDKILVINFWATWCAPCREEIPELNTFYKNNNVQLIGIAIDEVNDVIKFQDDIPINYPSYIANDIDGVELTKNLGNDRGVLPFTVIINPEGLIKKAFYGKVEVADLRQALGN
jgi:thiol-disulfide isomerase/thioredoxin